MTTTQERPTTTEPVTRPWWRRPIVLMIGLVVLAAAVVAGILLAGGGDDEPTETTVPAAAEPAAVMQQFAEHFRNGDVEAIAAMWGPGAFTSSDREFTEWRIAMQAEPEVSDCRVIRETGTYTSIQCTMTDGPDSFGAQLGVDMTTTISADVSPDGDIMITSAPPPAGYGDALVGFRLWAIDNRPAESEIILGTDWSGLTLSRESGELSMSLLSEYQAYLAAPTGTTPEGIMELLVAAVQEVDPEAYADLTYVGQGENLAAEDEFLQWQVALGLDPTFSDCEQTALLDRTLVRCTVTAGPDYFYAQVANEPVAGTVSGEITDGVLNVTAMPPQPGVMGTEGNFRSFIRQTHPDVEDKMFGSLMGIFRLGTESGELHMQYLDEYLAYLATPPLTPSDVAASMLEAVQAVDPVAYADLTFPRDDVGPSFLGWNVAMGMDPTFTECGPAPPPTGSDIICNVTMGDDYFFSTVVGANLETILLVGVEESEMRVNAWPPPDGLLRIERSFRNWIAANHPEQVDAMFGDDFAGVLRFTEESRALHADYLEEYLAYLASAEGLTPDDVMTRMRTSVIEANPDVFADITYVGFEQESEGKAFLEWQLALGMDPTFSDCAVVEVADGASTVGCAVTMGANHFHSIVIGEDAPLDLFVNVQDGVFGVLGWPPTEDTLAAEEALRSWIQGMHPEAEEAMFGEILGVFDFSPDSAELHMQYLDEYLLYRALNP